MSLLKKNEELLRRIIEVAEEEVLTLDDYTLRALLLSIRFLRETSKENLFASLTDLSAFGTGRRLRLTVSEGKTLR